MSSSDDVLSPHVPFTEFFPNVVIYAVTWSILFLAFHHLLLHLPAYLSLTSHLPPWYIAIPQAKQRHYLARLLFSTHHFLVAYYALCALLFSSPAFLLQCMYHEVACDLFDVAVIAFSDRGFTGLNWQGLLLHHLLSILAILVTFTLRTPLSVLAQLALLLDGTGATDYLFSTVLAHTPLIQQPLVLGSALAVTLLFFVTRLFYFPVLALRFIASAFETHWTSGVVCAGLMAGVMFFNVGMIRTRTKQYRALWNGAGEERKRDRDEEDRSVAV
jgi:hypothetical protein